VRARSLKKNLLSRLLTRKISLVPIDIDHMPYLWAAYRMGVWEDFIKPDLNKDKFTNTVAGFSELSELMIVVTDKPIGLVSIRQDARALEIHVDWFPWATSRNKIEGTARSILDLRGIKTLLIWSKWETNPFFTYIAKYGIIRRVGTFNGDEKYALFQSKGA